MTLHLSRRLRHRAPARFAVRGAGLVAFLLLAGTAPPVDGQQAAGDGFTLERIHGSADFATKSVSATWLPDGGGWAIAEAEADGTSELWRVDAASGERTRLIAASELVPAGADRPLEIDDFGFSADGRRVLLFANAQQVWRARTKGEYWLFDLESRTLTPTSRSEGWQMFAKLSPDGRMVAFVRDHDLFVTDLETGEERRLTTSGSENVINGTTDWVYEEELGLRDAFRWSPDGSRIAYWQLDQSEIRPFYLIDETSLYPELISVRYPKAGTPNSKVRVGSLEIESGETTWFDLGPEEDLYVARMEWAASSAEVAIQRLNRHQNRLDVLLGDARTGETRLLFSETDDAWVDVDDDLTWIAGGARFLWSSERDGWRHLYLYDRAGRLLRQLTAGEWEVTSLDGVDESSGRVFFTAAFDGPLTRSLLAVRLEGGEPTVLAGGRGSYSATYSPDFRHAIASYSTIETPPRWTLRRVEADGLSELRPLEENEAVRARLDSIGLAAPEFLELQAADGTPLNAYIIKPPDFDPNRRYGLLVYVYGGPGSQTVADRWGGYRYVWHQYLARRGVLVASVDNRGTGARGRDFKKQTYLRLGQLETADQLAVIRQLGELSYVDASRIGIWGWSYGGYMALMVTLQSKGAVAAGVSVAPVSHWKLYDTIYTERYMRTPRENPVGYERGAPLSYAADLASPLLIVHGTGDDNVHAQNTVLMVQALEEADKQFRLRLYPSKRHGISGPGIRVNLFGMITGFLLERLGPAGAAETAVGPGG